MDSTSRIKEAVHKKDVQRRCTTYGMSPVPCCCSACIGDLSASVSHSMDHPVSAPPCDAFVILVECPVVKQTLPIFGYI